MRSVFVLFIVLWGAPLFSQTNSQEGEHATPSERADAHYQSAMQLYSEGRYRESIQSFDAAINLVQESIFYCNRAAVHLELAQVDLALSDLRSCRSRFEGDPDDAAIIDSQTLGVEVASLGVVQGAKFTAEETQRVLLEPNTETSFGVRGWGVVTLAVGAGAIASAIVVDRLSGQLVEDFVRESEGREGTTSEQFDDLKSRVETRQIVFYTLAITGAVLSTAGVAMIIFGGDSETDSEAGLRVSPGNITVYGSF